MRVAPITIRIELRVHTVSGRNVPSPPMQISPNVCNKERYRLATDHEGKAKIGPSYNCV